jgi:hypothetical protein
MKMPPFPFLHNWLISTFRESPLYPLADLEPAGSPSQDCMVILRTVDLAAWVSMAAFLACPFIVKASMSEVVVGSAMGFAIGTLLAVVGMGWDVRISQKSLAAGLLQKYPVEAAVLVQQAEACREQGLLESGLPSSSVSPTVARRL